MIIWLMLNRCQTFVYKFFDRAEKANRKMICSSSAFKENHIFIEEENPSDKVVMVKEELDGTDIDRIGNIVDLPS